MREAKGKLICIWSPILHGEGCSTITNAVGFALNHYTGKKTLIVNKSGTLSHMENYIAHDIEIKYSMDNLKIFNSSIKSEHISTYATQINNDLYMIAGSRINREITKEDKGFEELFIKRCLDGFELVVVDMNTGVREDSGLYLNRADVILAVTAPNDIVLGKVFKYPGFMEVMQYLNDEKTVYIFNKLYDGWNTAKIVDRLKKKYSIRSAYGLNYDGDVLDACCTNLNFYSFMIKELKKSASEYAGQISDICEYLADRLYPEWKNETGVKGHRIFGRLLKSSLF